MRIFIAIKVPDSIKEEISKLQKGLDIQFAEFCGNVRWVAPQNIHLTLKFLGEVPEEQIETIIEAIESSLGKTEPFDISFEEVGGFPNLKRPRVLWVGAKQGKAQLIELMQKLNEKLSAIGFETEARESVPHLTIGRIKKVKNLEFKVKSFKATPFPVERIYLIKSKLTPQGPIYTDIKEFRL
ncbi:RNA 2',3'-cyclic phosphodiesterase [candidate division WOR-3 bacterium]|nr:RNA 2',3'-cyclic phosphodiesterase [candidate division WOR-3 bacterium]